MISRKPQSESHASHTLLTNCILQGDCLKRLKTLPSNSIDLVCTDPPYGIGHQGGDFDTFKPEKVRKDVELSKRKNGPDCDFASPALSAARYDHSPQGARRFQEWFRSVSTELLRVLKPGAFAFVCIGTRQDSVSAVITALADAGFKTDLPSLFWTFASSFPKALNIGKAVDKRHKARREIIGYRRMNTIRSERPSQLPLTGGPVSADAKRLEGAYAGYQPKPAVEIIVVAMKPLSEKTSIDEALKTGKGVTWLDPCRIPAESAANDGKDTGPSARRFPANLLVSDQTLGRHSQFFSLDAWAQTLPFLVVPKAGRQEKLLAPTRSHGKLFEQSEVRIGKNTHPTVKPLRLMSYLVTLGSRPGDLVLDPFLGSGTTAVAAKLLGRRYLGIEQERPYIAIAQKRLANARMP